MSFIYRVRQKYLRTGVFAFFAGILTLSIATSFILPQQTAYAACDASKKEYAGSDDTTSDAYQKGAISSKECYVDIGGKAQPASSGHKPEDTGKDKKGKPTSCAVETIGWILCPIMKGAAFITDNAFSFISNYFLTIEPELLAANNGTSKSGTYEAWSKFQQLANVAFILAFVVIIISQVTSFGISNYGIKRMLPRLIIAAIAVNASYFICQLVVDFSNILGVALKDGLTSLSKEVLPSAAGATNAQKGAGIWGGVGIVGVVITSILATAAIVWLMLPVAGSVVLFAIAALIMCIIILLLRKAFIVILVVISPLAFVAYLLPNTEQYFKKWLSMFWKLLLVFPIVALLMGGGQLASSIILSAGATDKKVESVDDLPAECYQTQKNTTSIDADGNISGQKDCEVTVEVGENKRAGVMLGLVATGVAVAPLFAVWSVLQGAIAAAGVVGGKLGGAINNIQQRQKKGLGKRLEQNAEMRKQQLQTRALDIKGNSRSARSARWIAGRSASREAQQRIAKENLGIAQADYISNKSYTDGENGPALTDFGQKLAGGRLGTTSTQNRTLANAMNMQANLNIQEVKAAHAEIDNFDSGQLASELGSLVDSNGNMSKESLNDPRVAAMLERYAKVGDKTDSRFTNVTNAVGRGGTSVSSRALASGLEGEGYLTKSNLDEISRGSMGSDLHSMVAGNLANGIYSQGGMANAGKAELEFAQHVAKSVRGAQGDAAIMQLKQTAQALQANDRLNSSIGRNKDVVNSLSSYNRLSR